jgi:hypothetical protein
LGAAGAAVLLGALLLTVGSGSSLADEPVLLADQADGVIDTEGIRRIEISGIQGTLTLRAGQAGKLRFACRSLDNRREERPVALWETESTMRLAFSEQLESQRLLLEVALPAEMSGTVHAEDSNLVINGVRGDLDLTGKNLVFAGRSLGGDIDLNITGGSVTVILGEGNVDIEGRDLQTKLAQIAGDVEISQVGGRLELLEIAGSVSLDVEETDVVSDLIGGELTVQATRGTLSFNHAQGRGVFELSEAPLKLLAPESAIEVDTDAAVEFENVVSSLSVRSYGGGLSGTGAKGVLQFSGSDGEVRVGQLEGDASIVGDQLKVSVKGVSGNLTVNTTSSEVSVTDAGGRVDLTNDFGDVKLERVAKAIKIVSRDGNVEVNGLQAPANVKADGPQLTVHWAASSREANSSIENAGGDVRVLFSPQGGGRLDAEARHGRIETKLPDVKVAEDGTRAAGIINRQSSPTIRVVSGGDLFLGAAPAAVLSKPGQKKLPVRRGSQPRPKIRN